MGALRAVRGVLLVADQRLELMYVWLVHATAEKLVLTGFECNSETGCEIDSAQTWVMSQCEGDHPEGTGLLGSPSQYARPRARRQRAAPSLWISQPK